MTQFFAIIRDQSDRMRQLIGDLLDVARIEAGTLPVAPEPTDLRALVDEARAGFLTVGARIPWKWKWRLDLPWVETDRRRVVQVLENLLSNAAGYSPEGSPIAVSAVRTRVRRGHGLRPGAGHSGGPDAGTVRRFARAHDRDAASGVDGSGLGLAVCKG